MRAYELITEAKAVEFFLAGDDAAGDLSAASVEAEHEKGIGTVCHGQTECTTISPVCGLRSYPMRLRNARRRAGFSS